MPYLDRERKRDAQRLWLARRRAEYLADKVCAWCGWASDLEIDHVDRATKVDHRVWSWRAERRATELAKCQVLCARCHLAKTLAENEATRAAKPSA